MKPVYRIFLLSMVFLCAGCTEPKVHEPTSAEKKQQEQQMMQQQIHELLKNGGQKEYEFALQIRTDQETVQFEGKQAGENWVITDAKGKKVMERKNEKVWAYHLENKEEMTVNQAGLVSPKDHLFFLKKVLGKVEYIQKWKSSTQKKAKITVDPYKLSDQFKTRLNTSNAALFPVYEDFDIYYELIYSDSPDKQLKQIILNMSDEGKAAQTLIYTLEM